MKMIINMFCFYISLLIIIDLITLNGGKNITTSVVYNASWESLDKRPIPNWYDEAKIGILVHWGVHSVPSYYSERFYEAWQIKNKTDENVVQFMKKNYLANFTYQDFGRQFKAEFFDANRLTDTIVQSGAKYVIAMAKHHDGFCMWPSAFANDWHVGAIGPKRDLLLETINSVRLNSDLYVGILYSFLEWTNSTFMAELNNPEEKNQTVVKNKLLQELFYLAAKYQPDLIRAGGSWLATSTYYKTEKFLKWLFNESPNKDTVVINDQWGSDTFCKHGGYYQCDNIVEKNRKVHKFENVMGLDLKSWSYRREATADDYMSLSEMIKSLVITISSGGNIVFSIGLTKEGFLAPLIEQRLLLLGKWLHVNGEAIYGTMPWIFKNDSSTSNDVWYTSRVLKSTTVVYAIFLQWPNESVLKLSSVTPYWATSIKMLPYPEPLNWTLSSEGLAIKLKPPLPGAPSWNAWVLRLKCLKMYSTA